MQQLNRGEVIAQMEWAGLLLEAVSTTCTVIVTWLMWRDKRKK
jgi:hypothetical protein